MRTQVGSRGVPDDGLRIREIEAIPLRIPFRNAFTMAAPGASRAHVDVLVVRLDAGDGLVGLGESQAWRRQGSGEEIGGLARVVRELYRPLLLDRAPLEVNALLRDLEHAAPGRLYAQAAAGDALYDLAARSLGLPLCSYLGGRLRASIPVGIALGIRGSPAAIADAAADAVAAGYRHVRLKIGLDTEADVANVRAVRDRLGARVVLRADANGGLAFPAALRLLTRLAEFDLEYVEQPVAGHDLAGMAALARAVPIPLSADESVHDEPALIELIRKEAAAIIQTKSGKNGGVHRIRRLWQIAAAAGIGIFPGNHPATSLNVAAVAHLAAAWHLDRRLGHQVGLRHTVVRPDRPDDGLRDQQLPDPGGAVVPLGRGGDERWRHLGPDLRLRRLPGRPHPGRACPCQRAGELHLLRHVGRGGGRRRGPRPDRDSRHDAGRLPARLRLCGHRRFGHHRPDRAALGAADPLRRDRKHLGH